MNRRKIFAWIVGALGMGTASAQTLKLPTEGGGCFDGRKRIPCPILPSWQTGKAKNNQCPVCGTMAEPLKKSQWVKQHENVGWVLGSRPLTEADAPTQVLTRCAKCSSAFYCDSE
jgi:hypothetical protein